MTSSRAELMQSFAISFISRFLPIVLGYSQYPPATAGGIDCIQVCGLALRRTNTSDYIERLASVRDDVCEWPTEVRDFRFVFVKHFETTPGSTDYRLELLIDLVGARECCFTFIGGIRSLRKLRLGTREDLFRSVMLDCKTCYPRSDFSE